MIKYLAGAVAVAMMAPGLAGAQTFNFESSTVTPGGQQISIVRLPVKRPNGKLEYKDVVMQFEFVGGQLRFAEGFPKVVASDISQPGPFIAGDYPKSGDGITLSGPLPGPDGRTRHSMFGDYVMEFYTGATEGHPLQNRIRTAGIKANYTFGVVTNGDSFVRSGDLVALVQVDPKTLQVLDFTSSGKDVEVPVNVYTFKR